MPDFSSISFPQPKDWQAFERSARVLFEHVLNDPNTQNNGRPGQRQHGVDVFGRRGGAAGPLVGIQCKGKDIDYGGAVTEAELEREVEKTTKFKPALREFILITTAPDDARIQEQARLLEEKVRRSGRDLSIAVWGWGRMQQEISRYPEAIKAFHPDVTPFSERILDRLDEINSFIRVQASARSPFNEQSAQAIAPVARTLIASDDQVSPDPLDQHLNQQIDTYRDLVRDGRSATALDLLSQLRQQVWETASSKIRFRILSNIGAAHHRLAHYDLAADFFIEAAGYDPDAPVSIANKIAALLIKHRDVEAHELAVAAFTKHPQDTVIALQRLQARAAGESVEEVWQALPSTVIENVDLVSYRIMALRDQGDLQWHKSASVALAAHPDHPALQILAAESALGRVLEADPSALGLAREQAPTQDELGKAALALEALWEASIKSEIPPELTLAHNAALLRNILGEPEKSELLLDAAFLRGLDHDEAKRLRVSLYRRKGAVKDAIRLADTLSDTAQNRIIRADLRAETAPAEARALLPPIAAITDRRDRIAASLVVIESLIAQSAFDDALAEANSLEALHPDDPYPPLARYRIQTARACEDAERDLDIAFERISNTTDLPTRFLVGEALGKAGRYDEIVDLLTGHVGATFDSQGLRMLVAAAANADRRYALKRLLEQLPEDLLQVPFYRGAQIALAIHSGDTAAAERNIRAYLSLRPRHLEMQLQLMHLLFRQGRTEELRAEAARPGADFDGPPEDFLKFAQFKDEFGDWRNAHELAYATLLANRNDAAVALGYAGVFLRQGHSAELEVSPEKVSEHMAVQLRTREGKTESLIIEPNSSLRPSPDYLAPTHKTALRLIGQRVGAEIELPDGTSATITSIVPKTLHALHKLLEGFQNSFPDAKGLESVRITSEGPEAFAPLFERVRERHEAFEIVSKLYDAGSIPLALTARMLGSDPADILIGLSTSGHNIHVCAGMHTERESAFAAIDANAAKGCVVDAATLHIIRRLDLGTAVAAVCGPIGIVDPTVVRVQQKIHELNERVDEPDMSLSWRDGQACRTETTPGQKREALALLESDQRWMAENTTVLPAEGDMDPSANMRQLMKRFGSSFADELRAAQGASRLLVCEDQSLRVLAQAEFDVPSTWLQPVLMKAAAANKITRENYCKAIVAFIDARFEFISIDASMLIGSVAGLRALTLPPDFTKLASRLGGKSADLPSHVNVAFGAIRGTWNEEALPWIVRQAIASSLLENLCKDRQMDHVTVILHTFAKFGQDVLADRGFLRYLDDWMRGHFILPEVFSHV